jgi:type II secretory pathway pseudopilin PulG
MSQQRYVCRWGFSMLDLLVMVALLLLLMALMLPAIMRVRAAAGQMKCANNLRQIVIAFHNYHNDYNIFPSGGGHAEQGRAYSSAGKTERNPPLGGKLPDGAQVVPAPSQEWG